MGMWPSEAQWFVANEVSGAKRSTEFVGTSKSFVSDKLMLQNLTTEINMVIFTQDKCFLPSINNEQITSK